MNEGMNESTALHFRRQATVSVCVCVLSIVIMGRLRLTEQRKEPMFLRDCSVISTGLNALNAFSCESSKKPQEDEYCYPISQKWGEDA